MPNKLENLTYSDLIKIKNKLDDDLRILISDRLEQFKQETGLYPQHIYVDIVDISTVSGKQEHVISHVATLVQL